MTTFLPLLLVATNAAFVLSSCDPGTAALYQVTLQTHWSPDKFPRQYPAWRPPAQWSPVFGFSHGSNVSLYSVGTEASDGVAAFVETGSTESLLANLDMETVLDIVTAPGVTSGQGSTSTTVFVDGRHAKVSLMSKLVPSPDWFVGVDSLDMCHNHQFVEQLSRHLDPHDGGTDNGFTFTSPNWPTQPRGVIFAISSQYPTHPAGSFFYPHLDKLPSIATIKFKKLKEYKEVPKAKQRNSDKYKYIHWDQKLNKIEDLNFVPLDNSSRDKFLPLRSKETTVKKKGPKKNLASFHNPFSGLDGTPSKSDFFLDGKSFETPVRRRKRKLRGKRHFRNKGSKRKKKSKKEECKVGSWGEWSSCSMSCGIGERVRTREIVRPGARCPDLKRVSWCGSARDCHQGYFDW